MTEDPGAEIAAVLEEARLHSHAILEAHGHELPQLLQDKDLWATIDRGHARAFLVSENAVPLAESLGASLRGPHRVMVAIEALQLLAFVSALVLAFLALRWWGLILVVLIPAYAIAAGRSAQLPRLRGHLPKLAGLAFAAGAAFLFAQGSSWPLYSLLLALGLVSLCSVLGYAHPVRVVRRVLVEQPQLARPLVDASVVTLHRASELPEVRNRGF